MAQTNSGGRPVFHCILPQRQAVLNDLMAIGFPSPDVRGVDRDGYQMRGLEGGTFVNLTTYPDQPGDNINEIIQAMGWAVLTFDDSAFRARMRRCYGGR